MKHLKLFENQFDIKNSESLEKFEEIRQFFLDYETDEILINYKLGYVQLDKVKICMNFSPKSYLESKSSNDLYNSTYFEKGFQNMDNHIQIVAQLCFQIKKESSPLIFDRLGFFDTTLKLSTYNIEILQLAKRLENLYDVYFDIINEYKNHRRIIILFIEKS